MVSLQILLAILASVVCASSANVWQPGPAVCGCFNIAYIDRPNQINECTSKAKFLNQINSNFNNLQLALLINGFPDGCKFAAYEKRVNEMKRITVQMVETYFSCTEANCTAAVMAAYQKFVDYRTEQFNPITRCAYTNFDKDCAQVLIQARPGVYGSAENILVGLLACSKLKADPSGAHCGCGTQKASTSPLTSIVLPKNQEPDCNCVKIDPRPIPENECECFSHKFIAKLKNFVGINFGRVIDNYNQNNSTCDYTQFYGYVQQLKGLAISSTKLLEKPNPKMADLDGLYQQYNGILGQYSPAVRNFILNNDKSCYFNIRKARQNPLAITDAVLGILTQCVGYVDSSQHYCAKFSK